MTVKSYEPRVECEVRAKEPDYISCQAALGAMSARRKPENFITSSYLPRPHRYAFLPRNFRSSKLLDIKFLFLLDFFPTVLPGQLFLINLRTKALDMGVTDSSLVGRFSYIESLANRGDS